MNNYLIPVSKHIGLDKSGVRFPKVAFSELNDVAKFVCVKVQ